MVAIVGFFLVMGIVGIVVVLAALLLGDVIDGIFDIDFLGGDLFSIAGLAAFIGAFGFGGYISLALINLVWLATVVGLVAGGLAAWGATSLTRWLKRSENAASFRTESVLGASGKVITDIPVDGFGEVRIHGYSGTHKWAARSSRPLAAGVEVWVSGIVSPTALEVTIARDPLEKPDSQ